jgi:signal peptidase I
MTFALILFSLLLLTGAIWLLDAHAARAHRVNEPVVDTPRFPVILVVPVALFLVEPFKIPSVR